jgi:hypothetical protein
MAEKASAGQADKAEAEVKTATVGDEATDLPPSGAADPYPNYDFMTLEDLQSLADERGVEVNRDVLKAHLITELRAADSGTPSAVTKHGAR